MITFSEQWMLSVPGARVPSNQVPKLPQDITPHLNQVLMAGGSL